MGLALDKELIKVSGMSIGDCFQYLIIAFGFIPLFIIGTAYEATKEIIKLIKHKAWPKVKEFWFKILNYKLIDSKQTRDNKRPFKVKIEI